MAMPEGLKAHLATGVTNMCRVWAVTRRDGLVLGFTDHDMKLSFGGVEFMPETGMTASAVAQSTGLSVDNTEAFGALSSEAVTEDDILAGRFDGAEVRAWNVNWANVSERVMVFRGTMGEISRGEGAFTAELRGLTEALSRETGLVFHSRCSAILGDERCGVDTTLSGYSAEVTLDGVEGGRIFSFGELTGFEDRWFEKGRFVVIDGAAAGLVGVVKNDRLAADGSRTIELWQAIGAPIAAGERVLIVAGCDRRGETCRLKFDNFDNFRGFPHIPGDDWLNSYPVQSGGNDGGSLFQ
jgi:uncharacterized phage protein (TIGR02218 family)